VTVAVFLAHSLPLVLIAAVSPVLFLNASRVVEAAGISAGLFTTLPLYLSVSQRIGSVVAPWWARALLLALVVVVVAAPVWLPVGLKAVAPERSRIKPETRGRIQTATQWISIGACFVGGAVIIWHVLQG
jgi:hypothetical protein